MACVNCFFDNLYQVKLKAGCKGDFIDRLKEYKEKYISDLERLKYISECSCNHSLIYLNNNDEKDPDVLKRYINFCNDFLNHLKNNVEQVKGTFDEIIKIYKECKNGNTKEASKLLKEFVDINCYKNNSSMNDFFVLFRARNETNDYDKFNIKEYFHVPFNKRDIIDSQRFSLKGEPMLYCAISALTAVKEINSQPNRVNIAAFLPMYSELENEKFYNIENSIGNIINNNLYRYIKSGSSVTYDNKFALLSKDNLKSYMAQSILYQILVFPRQEKNSEIIDEYLLPQLFTEIAKQDGYAGIRYQSSKILNMRCNYSYLSEIHKEIPGQIRSNYDINYCYFVSQDKFDKYNEKLLSKFYTAYIEKDDIDNLKDLRSVRSIIEDLKKKVRQAHKSQFDYRYNIENHIDLLVNIDYEEDGYEKEYYNSYIGKVELTLIYKIIEQIIKEF